MITTNKSFDVLTSPLAGKNLVEASAGTGKTFSIALLALRLMLEKQLKLKELLIVTFTNDATAELQDRIRRFIRLASLYASGKEIGNNYIEKIVDNAKNLHGEATCIQLLKDATYLLDEHSIFTIDGFSQRILSEFAVETKQFLNTELINDGMDAIQELTKAFWRDHINILPLEILNTLAEDGSLPTLEEISGTVRDHLNGILTFNYNKDNITHKQFVKNLEDTINDFEKKKALCEKLREEFSIEVNKDEKKSLKAFGKRNMAPVIEDPFESTKDHDHIAKIYPEILSLYINFCEAHDSFNDHLHHSKLSILHFAVNKISSDFEDYKTKFQLSTFADFINNLHAILSGPNAEKLKESLQKRYKAVFIDEFQDTNRKQYEIFRSAFGEADTPMYFIGDPKQSIYEFRGGDVDNYLAARNHMDNIFTMNTNYRSAKPLLNDLNTLLKPTSDFDTFHYQNETDRIDYHFVEGPEDNHKPFLVYEEKAFGSITGYKSGKAEMIPDEIAILVQNLLKSGRYKLNYACLLYTSPSPRD